jgi:hypothetical protein
MNWQKLAEAEKQRQALIDDLYRTLETLEGRRIRPQQRTQNFLLDALESAMGKLADWLLRRIPQYRRVRQ